jgi:PAS domain S-box-containing protein
MNKKIGKEIKAVQPEKQVSTQALLSSEARYRRLFETARDGILILDADSGQIVDVNPFLIEMLGYTRNEFLDKKLWQIGIFKNTVASKKAFLELQTKGYVRYEDMPLETKDGRHIDVEFVSNIYLVDHERVIQCNIRDITKRKQIDMRLKTLNENLEKTVKERTADLKKTNEQLRALAFELSQTEQRERRRLAQMLHGDLQQLIAGAKFNLHAIIHTEKDSSRKKSLQEIDEFLKQSLESSRMLIVELSPPILYESGLSAALEWLFIQMQKNYDLKVEFDNSLNESIPEDISVLLFSIAKELLFNTVKHSGQLRAKLSLSKTENQSIRMDIQDYGKGFAVKDVEPCEKNERFGLFNIRNRVEILKGNFSIDSSPQKGSKITIDLPFTFAEPETVKVSTIKSTTVTYHKAVDGESNNKIRLFLVDDHTILRKGLKVLLQHELDMEVIDEASDGIEAVEKAEQLRPDVILMDINMPRMNGIDATKEIIARMPDMKIIGLSIHEDPAIIHTMISAGAVGYITKGSPTEELCAEIRKVVNSRVLSMK